MHDLRSRWRSQDKRLCSNCALTYEPGTKPHDAEALAPVVFLSDCALIVR